MSGYELGDDLEPVAISREEVERRVDDWLARLDDLMAGIRTWAARHDWTIREGQAIPMHEEPMDRVGIAERDQPSLVLRSPSGSEIWIKPKGLWVIGANGRVDLFSRNGVFTLVDLADQFEPPRWVLHRVGGGNGQRFDPEQLAEMA